MQAKFNLVEILFVVSISFVLASGFGYLVGQRTVDIDGLLAHVNTSINNLCLVNHETN